MIYQAEVRRRLSRGGLLAIGLLALVVLPGWSHGPLVGQEAEAPPGETASESPSAPAVERAPKGEAGPAASPKALVTEQVFVAICDIPAGEAITAEMLKLEEWPIDKRPSGALTRLQDVQWRRPRSKIYAGTPILESQLGALGAPPEPIPRGYRVVSIHVDEASTTSDLIRPGDRVDVRFMPHDADDAMYKEQRTILIDVSVFAVHEASEPLAAGKVVSLLVTPQQAEKLTMAAESGRIDLAQRPSTGRGRPHPAQKMIEVFRLKHRDPAEMMEIATALFRLVAGKEDLPDREVTVLAVVKAPVRVSGMPSGGPGTYPGGPGRYPGMMSSMAGGMMPAGMGGYEEEAYGMEMDMAAYPGPSPEPRGLPELRLSVDRRTGALIARASQEAMEILRMLVAALDTPDDSLPAQIEKALPGMRLVKFRHRTTEEMIRVLQELGINVQVAQVPLREGGALTGQGGGETSSSGASRYSPTRFVQRGGTLIAAGDRADLDQIEQLIQALDVEGEKGRSVPAGPGAPSLPRAGAPSRY